MHRIQWSAPKCGRRGNGNRLRGVEERPPNFRRMDIMQQRRRRQIPHRTSCGNWKVVGQTNLTTSQHSVADPESDRDGKVRVFTTNALTNTISTSEQKIRSLDHVNVLQEHQHS